MTTLIHPESYGAKADGVSDDSDALQAAVLTALACNGAVMLAPGRYLITKCISFPETAANLSIMGCGSNVTVIVAQQCQVFDFAFAQNGAQQPWGVQMSSFSVEASGECPLAISISYGWPALSNDHDHAPNSMRNIHVMSGAGGFWREGLKIVGAWNFLLDNVWLSGNSYGGDWCKLSGAGISFRGSCVNAHLVNVRCNFWADGIKVSTRDGGPNTEGLFISNVSMVAVKRGIHIIGSATAPAPRMSTITVTGGLIECRVGGVSADEISTGIFLENVWTALITNVQILSEVLPPEGKITYGVLPLNSSGVVVHGCDINAFSYGVHTAGPCRAIMAATCTFTNVEKQIIFAQDCFASRSYGHVLFNNAPFEWSWAGGGNKLGFVY